jgi:hypothetical protein
LISRYQRYAVLLHQIAAVFVIHGSSAGGYISPLLISGWPCCGLHRSASCFAVKAMPTDPWGQPLTPGPRFALQACSALLCAPLPMAWLANCKPMHGRYLWCVVAWPIWLGSSSPAGPTGHSRQLFLAHLRRVANQNKQPARPCSHQEKSLRPKLQRPKHADIAPACCCKFNFGGR